jgi:hypothetical protein
VMVQLVISSPSLREALHHYVRFRPPSIDTLKVRLDRRDSTAVLAFDFGYDASRQVASYVSMATPRVLSRRHWSLATPSPRALPSL